MTDDLRARLRARQLATKVVPLEGPGPDDPVEQVTLRQLAPDVWEALVAEHPPTEEDRASGRPWNPVTFRPALIAASVLDTDDRAVFSPEDIVEAASLGWLTVGQLLMLWDTATALNDRTPSIDDLGKD